MTLFLCDFVDGTLHSCDKIVEVADGFEVPCTQLGTIMLDMRDDNGIPFEVHIQEVLYVPGLTRRLFSVPSLCEQEYAILFIKNELTIYFGTDLSTPVTLPFNSTIRISANNVDHQRVDK